MAIFTPGGGVAAIRGSVGGNVYAANKAGPYIRNRAVPINPGSARQQAVRFAMAELVTRWVETLTPAQRAAWETYADAVHLPNSLGFPRNVGGIGMYVRSNVPRLSAVAPVPAVQDDAPTIFDLGTFTAPTIGAVSEATQQVSWAFDDADGWANEDGGAMLIFGSRPQNPSINFFKGPYRVMGTIPGSGTTPPTSPVTVNLPFPVVVGQKVFFRCRVTRADGRLASSFRGLQTVTA